MGGAETGRPATVRGVLSSAADRLRTAGVASPEADAQWLLAHVLHVPRGRLTLAPAPTLDQAVAFDALVRRRERREPLQHLLGRAAFRHLDLRVGPGVFVPRPETELLIDLVRARSAGVPGPVVVDLCAGSGALGLAAAGELDARAVVLVERSIEALPWLRANAADLPDPTRITVVAADVRDPGLTAPDGLLAEWRAAVDVVLCNPPYVPAGTPVGPEVRHDPGEAVFAGVHGLDLIGPVTGLSAQLLRDGGVLGLEHDETRQAEVLGEFGPGWRGVGAHRDLTGRPRFVTAVRDRGRG